MAKQNGTTAVAGDQTSVLEAPESRPAPKAPQPVQLRAPHDYQLTTVALAHRAEELTKLAKKTSDEGYKRQSREIQADADAINHHILPVFADQVPLPFVREEDLERDVHTALRVGVYRAFDGIDDPKTLPTVAAIARRRDDLLKALADRVTTFVIEVAAEAYSQGLAAREQSPQAIAQRLVSELRVH